MSNKLSYIEVNDIFDELIDENKRLKKYLKVSLKFKSFVHLIIDKLKNNLDSNDLQEFQQLSQELEDIFNPQMVTNLNYETKEINNTINTSSVSKTSHNLSKTSDNKGLDKNQIQSPDEDICSEKSRDKKESFICDFIGCGKYFISNVKLKKHSIIHTKINSKRNRFVCHYKDCDYKTDQRFYFINHIKKHQNIRDFICNFCEKGFYTKNHLNMHINGVHSSESFQCDYNNCNKVFKLMKSLENHKILCHSNETTISCDYPNCSFKCISNGRLIVHKRKHSNDRPFVCNVNDCSFASKHKRGLVQHLRFHDNSLKCLHEGCGKTFRTIWGLNIHSNKHLGVLFKCDFPGCEYQIHHNSLLERHMITHREERNFLCDWTQCGKRFKTKKYLEIHYRIHTNDKRFVCYWPGCQYRCVSSANLSSHIKAVHKKTNFQDLDKKESFICDFIGCGKYFISNEKLKKHSYIHTKINSKRNRFVCDYKDCDYKTDRPSKLKDHIKKHENIREFVCNYCDKGFNRKDALNSHIKLVHINSSQSFRCDYDNCNKVFKLMKSLENHKKLCHSNEKTFSCDYPNCGYKCVANCNLIVHKRKHSNDRPFKCSYDDCAYTAKYKQHLLAHLRSHSTPLKCLHEGCGKTFKTMSGFNTHSSKHLGVLFKCEWPGCEYQIHNKSLLRPHMITHREERNFLCDWSQCGKRFKTKWSLANHYRIHTNDKRFVCYWPGCQYRCVSSANLSIHIKGVHKKIKIGGRTKFE